MAQAVLVRNILLGQVMEQLLPGELDKLEESCRRARAAMATMAVWQPPRESVAPMPHDIIMVQEDPPRWFNCHDSEAITPGARARGWA